MLCFDALWFRYEACYYLRNFTVYIRFFCLKFAQKNAKIQNGLNQRYYYSGDAIRGDFIKILSESGLWPDIRILSVGIR